MSRRSFWCLFPVALAAVLAAALPAHADWAVLRNGQSLHISGYQRQGSLCILYLPGGEVRLPASAIARFEPEDVFPSALPQPAQPSGPFGSLVAKTARESGLSPKLLSSVIQAESNFQPHAVSAKGALGLMQLMPGTARGLTVRDPFDPSENVRAGARYLKRLLGTFGNLNLALAAYNAGPSAVRFYGGVPPFPETQAYIERVRGDMKSHAVPSNTSKEAVKLTCSPLEVRCRAQAVIGAHASGAGLP